MSRSNLVIARVGRNSLHASWLAASSQRNWDLCLCPYQALQAQDDGLGVVVIGLPRRLDGSANDQTARVRKLAELLASEITPPITLQDERLTSHEADELLAQREHDWRKRKQQVDAMAAALILQDFLDNQSRP